MTEDYPDHAAANAIIPAPAVVIQPAYPMVEIFGNNILDAVNRCGIRSGVFLPIIAAWMLVLGVGCAFAFNQRIVHGGLGALGGSSHSGAQHSAQPSHLYVSSIDIVLSDYKESSDCLSCELRAQERAGFIAAAKATLVAVFLAFITWAFAAACFWSHRRRRHRAQREAREARWAEEERVRLAMMDEPAPVEQNEIPF